MINSFFLFLDPVLGVDVTKNGEWILATCATYLMVIPVIVDGTNGFEKSLTGEKRLPGRRLELSRDHLWEMGGKVCSFFSIDDLFDELTFYFYLG